MKQRHSKEGDDTTNRSFRILDSEGSPHLTVKYLFLPVYLGESFHIGIRVGRESAVNPSVDYLTRQDALLCQSGIAK